MALNSQPCSISERPSDPANRARRVFGGVFVKRERWSLSGRGKVLAFLTALGLICGLQRALYPFLALTSGTQGQFLIVEGWVPFYALDQIADIVKEGRYQGVFVIGGLLD